MTISSDFYSFSITRDLPRIDRCACRRRRRL